VAVAAVLLAGAGGLHSAQATDVAADGSEMVHVIVEGTTAQDASVEARDSGGTVERSLGLVDAVAVEMTAAEAADLAAKDGIEVSVDDPITLHQVAEPTAPAEPRPATGVFVDATGARTVAASGVDGSGVTVAVLDSGIQNLPDFAGRLVGGIDLSGEGNPFHDGYGHGTFVAGLVAGNGASSGGAYVGEAPGAKLVAIKAAGASGKTRASTVIAGIHWAILNKTRLGIKVLNLSLGASGLESTTTSPLNRAVERAWDAGIVVVTSAGNFGPGYGSISKPGDDPLVVTVGASDDAGTATTTDDTVPAFSGVGPTYADGWLKPDLLAPGRSVVSLRVPGSKIDSENPTARIGDGNFKGTGTSFSTAIVSGAAAMVLQAHPDATPDLVKGRLLGTTVAGPVGSPMVDGHGLLSAYGAVNATGISFSQANAVRWGSPSPAVGGVVDLGSSWNGSSWNGSSWNGSSWNGSSWNGSSWNGSSWNGSSWNGSSWNGSSWNGSSWNGSSWNGSSWNGSSWNGSSWNGSSWNGSSWNGSSWNGSSWNGSSWNGSSWNGSSWNGSSWNGSSWNGSSWNGSSWNGSSWNGSSWN
jgi:serine protease AprX